MRTKRKLNVSIAVHRGLYGRANIEKFEKIIALVQEWFKRKGKKEK